MNNHNHILHDHEHDGIDRRGFLECMAWAGTGLLWTVSGGVLVSKTLAQIAKVGTPLPATDLSFLQISDSHIGFSKEANKDVTETFKIALDRINAMPTPPSFLIHTGDITQLSKPEEFDTFDQLVKGCRTKDIFFVPGEHDVLNDAGKLYRDRYLKSVEAKGSGWYSFNKNGVHFIGLVNVLDLQAGGLGQLGDEQLEWLEADVKNLGTSTPIVVFAHIPLWAVYPQWGWGTSDSERALGYLKRFGSVTVLNGHIHQVLQKVEGNVAFHTAMSTAFPQPAPGTAPSPGPMTVPAGRLRDVLGITTVGFVPAHSQLAVVDAPLSAGGGRASAAPAGDQVAIDNFSFTPAALTVAAGTKVTWINRDDVPHKVVANDRRFASPVLDTDEKFSLQFSAPGAYP